MAASLAVKKSPRSSSVSVDLKDILRFLNRDFLSSIEKLVEENEDTCLPLKSHMNAIWRICDVPRTIYRDKEDVVKGWGMFFLPDDVKMQVLGEVEGTPYPCDQLILMTCEDRKVYGFDGEELHVVALSVEQLCEKGIQYPALQSYYKGEAFKDMTDEDWDLTWQSDVGKELDAEHEELLEKYKSSFLKSGSGGGRRERGRALTSSKHSH